MDYWINRQNTWHHLVPVVTSSSRIIIIWFFFSPFFWLDWPFYKVGLQFCHLEYCQCRCHSPLWQDDCPYFHCTYPGWWWASLLWRGLLTNGTGPQGGVAGGQADPVHWPAYIWELVWKNKQKWTVSPDVPEREQRLKLGIPLTRLS